MARRRYPHSPATTWRRALARADRRLADARDADEAVRMGHLVDDDHQQQLAREAIRLANRIYMTCVHRPKVAA